MDLAIHWTFLSHDDPDASLAFYRDMLGFEVRNDVAYGGMRWITAGPPTSPARRFRGFPFVFKLDKTHRVDVTHDFRSDHDRLFHPGNQDRAASRIRPGGGQGGVRRPARRTAADRRVLLRRLRGCGPADRAGAERWTAGHDLTGGLLARAGHRSEAGRGDRRGCQGEGARARRRWRPPGGHRHRPRWQRSRAASGPMSADPALSVVATPSISSPTTKTSG